MSPMIDRLANRSAQCLVMLGVVCLALYQGQAAMAKDLLLPREQKTTESGSIQSPSFDDQGKGIPQSLFTWIKIAKGFEVEWDTFGRTGWYAQDPRLKPIEPGVVFTPEIPVIYIVFEVAPLEDPTQFAAQWYVAQPNEQVSGEPIGNDVLELSGHERYGYLELKRSGLKWAVGQYVAKIYISPLGQQPFHAGNQVGTIRFSVADTRPGMRHEPPPAR